MECRPVELLRILGRQVCQHGRHIDGLLLGSDGLNGARSGRGGGGAVAARRAGDGPHNLRPDPERGALWGRAAAAARPARRGSARDLPARAGRLSSRAYPQTCGRPP